jgi:HPt (histidine-containing phosphotransfer) domain-containing protein
MPFDPALPDALADALGRLGALDALAEHVGQAPLLLEEAIAGPAPARAAHRLAGCAGQLGMTDTADAARALERRLRRDSGLPSPEEAAHLRAAFSLEWTFFQTWAALQEA